MKKLTQEILSEQEGEEQKYPDLFLAINKLENRKADATPDRVPLLEKWIEALTEVNKEMRHLERIEEFTNTIKNPFKHKESDHDG